MAFLYHVFVVFAFYSVLGEWANVAAVNEATAIRAVPSPSVTKNGSSLSNATSHHMATTPSHNMSSATPHNMTVTPQNTTVMPHNTTATPHNTTVTPHNTTVTPHNTTVMPHITTVTPHITTVTPHSSTIMPHNTTIMPHNSTVMPPHNMTITPSSAHTVVPTSSMYPTPAPAPKPGNFSVKDNGTICLFAYMAAKFDIMINSTKLSLKLPTNATVRGECDKSIQEPYISLNWQTMEGYRCNFTMHFVRVESETLKPSTEGRWAAANLTLSLNSTNDGPVYTFHSATGPLKQLSADYGYAYECLTQPINFKLNATDSNVNVTLTNIDFKPFDVRDGHLGNVEKCNPSTTQPTTPNPSTSPTGKSKGHVVAIAVGCSLAALVIIVGVGYMIGRRRRRNQAAGYRKL